MTLYVASVGSYRTLEQVTAGLPLDLLFNQIDDALDYFLNPRRLVATLRG